MRRKATILRNQNKDFNTKKKKYSNAVKGINLKYSSRARLNQLIESNKCQDKIPTAKVAINSGIKNDNTPLIFNSNVPFYSQI